MNVGEPCLRDRREGGCYLASKLAKFKGLDDVLVLALPRGGVPVRYEVATALGAPFDVFIVRKLGVPGHEELAMGAIASGGTVVVDYNLVRTLGIPQEALNIVIEREQSELARRERSFRGYRPEPDFSAHRVILVDDGLATGSSMLAAVKALRERHPKQIIVAVPVAARETCDSFRAYANDVICAVTPEPFFAVGVWYSDFTQTSDEEVRSLLEAASGRIREKSVPGGWGV